MKQVNKYNIVQRIISFLEDWEDPHCDDKYFEDTYGVTDIGMKDKNEALFGFLSSNDLEIIVKNRK